MKIVCDPKGFVGKLAVPEIGEFEAGVHEVADAVGELLLRNVHFRKHEEEPAAPAPVALAPTPAPVSAPAPAPTSPPPPPADPST